MEWLIAHWGMLATCLLIVSEALAGVVQLAFPANKGLSGILAGVIKFLQAVGPKKAE